MAQPTTEGVARCVADFAKRQMAAGHDVTVACPPGGDLPDWSRSGGARVVPWPARRSPGPWVLGETRRLGPIASPKDGSVGFDLVHLHSAKAGLAGRLALRGSVPTVFQPHAWSWLAAAGLVRGTARAWERAAARWTNRFICVSEAEADAGRAAGVTGRFEVIPNGVDLDAYPFAGRSERSEARGRLGLEETPTVVCLGRLSAQKGQDVLLRAWRAVAGRIEGARVVLVGDGPERARLEAEAGPGVLFAGNRTDPWDWLAAADVVAMPSRWEGMSMVMLEAMATGRPVVASDVAGAREALASEAGAVVPAEDPAALASALVARLADPDLAEREGRVGRERAERAHSLDATVARIEVVYRALLEP